MSKRLSKNMALTSSVMILCIPLIPLLSLKTKKKHDCFISSFQKPLIYFTRAWPNDERMKTAFKLMLQLSVITDIAVVAFGIRISLKNANENL